MGQEKQPAGARGPRRRPAPDGRRCSRSSATRRSTPGRAVAALPIGARQVVEICRAIAARARVVLMDEPTSSLPRSDVERLFALVRRLAARGVAVLYISHFLEETRAVASTYTVLRDGRTVGAGELAVGRQRRADRGDGRPHRRHAVPAAAPGPPGPVALEARALASPQALREASFALQRRRGARRLRPHGLGAHASWCAPCSGWTAAPPASCSWPAGRAATASRRLLRLRRGLGYLSEDRKGEGLALPLSIADNVTLTRLSAVRAPRCPRPGAAGRAGHERGRRARRAHGRPGAARPGPVRRQPAEARARPAAAPGRGRAAAGRAHPRRRRGEPDPDLRGDRARGRRAARRC